MMSVLRNSPVHFLLVCVDSGNCQRALVTFSCLAKGDTASKRLLFRLPGEDCLPFPESLPVERIDLTEDNLSKALNRAMELAQGRHLLFFHPTTQLLAENVLQRFADLFSKDESLGVLGVQTLLSDQKIYSCGRHLIRGLGIREHHANVGFNDYDFGQFPVLGEVDSVADSLVAIRSEVIEGGVRFDERLDGGLSPNPNFPRGLQFDDFCLQARVKGWRVLADASVKVVSYGTVENAWQLDPGLANARQRYYAYWRKKWGWNPEYPNLHHVRQKWGQTTLCRQIGVELLDHWPESDPWVDVLLPTWNNVKMLRECVESLSRSTYRKIKLYVLDNASVDGTSEYLKQLGSEFPFEVHVVRTAVNIGVPAAMNWLVEISSSPLLLRLDEDVILPETWLEPMIERLRQNPYAAAIGPKFVSTEDPGVIVCAEFRLWPDRGAHMGEPDRGKYDAPVFVNVHFGGCVLYRRKVFEKIGGFDLRLSVISWEDLDHLMAARVAGYDVIYDGTVKVKHPYKALKEIRPSHVANCRANGLKVIAKWWPDCFEILERSIDQSFLRKQNGATP